MQQEDVFHIISNYFRQLKKYHHRMVEHFDAEAIHQFRVTYKKLNALFSSLSFEMELPKRVKITGQLKVLYQLAGRIREIQLQQLRLKTAVNQQAEPPLGYSAWLETEIKLAQQMLLALKTSGLWHLGKRKKQQLSECEFSAHSFRRFAQAQWLSIHQLLSHPTDEDLHRVRKQLKTLQYNLDLFKQAEHEALSLELYPLQGENYYKNSLEQLGLFQDACNRLDLLNSAVLDKLNIDARLQLVPIKEQWQQEKEQLKKDILQQLALMQASKAKIKQLSIVK